MSSPYPKLNDRHIDQWKVTELKEELRSRGLKLSGNKEELVRRLASALEEVVDEENTDVGVDPGDDSETDKVDGSESVEAVEPTVVDEVHVEHLAPEQVENSDKPVQVNVEQASQTVFENSVETDKADRVANHVNDKADQNDAIMADNIDQEEKGGQGTSFDTKDVSGTDIKLSLDEDATDVRIEDSKPSIEDEKNGDVPENQVGIEQNSETSVKQNPETGVKNKDTMPSAEDPDNPDNNSPDQLNQVSAEVSPDLGLQVKSESITTTTTTSTTDNVSINVKNELKDNLNANNVNLELEVVKLEMVQPSSSEVTCAMDVELCKKIEDVEEGSPEKLNLDRISSDEFMQDIVENKPIKSNNNFEKEEDAEKPIDALVSGFSPENKDLNFEEESKPTGMTEKRKAEEQAEPKSNNEPKRQRRWNVATTKVSDSQTSNLTADTPKAALQPTLRKSFNRSNSSVSGDATPKERIVPPSLKPATTSLRIDRFLRPFTLKAVQELLAKTGTVSDFWMDQIKTHCYVTYSSVEEAVATRDALYNLQWPTNGGRQLIAEFVDPQEVKKHIEAPPQSPGPTTPGTQTTALPFQRQPPGPPPQSRKPTTTSGPKLPPPPPGPPPAAAKEMLPPPPPLPKEPEPPILTLDDLFRKTKTTPRIYYLPLSEEQVAAKRADHARRA